MTAAAIGEVVELGERVAVRSDDMTLIGHALHAVIAMELVNPDRADAVARARQILQGYGAEYFVDPDAAVRCARRFRAFRRSSAFSPTRILAEWPTAEALANGQTMRGWIDVLVETADGWVVIDHKSSPRPKSEWRTRSVGAFGPARVLSLDDRRHRRTPRCVRRGFTSRSAAAWCASIRSPAR